MTGFSRRAALAGLALLPAACASSPNPTLYTLATVPGAPRSGGAKTIELRSIALARYLERSQIVRSSEGYRLDVLSNEWWGEPLDSMLNRVLVQALSQRLPGSVVFAENGAISAAPDATVAVNVQRLDQNRDGAVVLLAQWSVTRRTPVSGSADIRVQPSEPGTSGLVAAMSQAVGQLADRLAGTLAG